MNLEKLSARDAKLIAPSDSDQAIKPYLGFWVGGAGNLRLTTVGGTDVLFSGIPAGTFLPIQAVRVWSTNTTASLIIGLLP